MVPSIIVAPSLVTQFEENEGTLAHANLSARHPCGSAIGHGRKIKRRTSIAALAILDVYHISEGAAKYPVMISQTRKKAKGPIFVRYEGYNAKNVTGSAGCA